MWMSVGLPLLVLLVAGGLLLVLNRSEFRAVFKRRSESRGIRKS